MSGTEDDWFMYGVEDSQPPKRVGLGKWRTRDGRVLSICDMDDQHLQNARTMLRKLVAKGRGSSGCGDWNDVRAAKDKIDEFVNEINRRSQQP